MRAVAGVLGMGGRQPAPVVAKAAPPVQEAVRDEAKRQRLAALWGECEPWNGSRLIADYLHGRGVPYPEQLPIHRDLRLHPRLAYWHSGRVIGYFPVMVAVCRDAAGKPCGLHQTYLTVSAAGEVEQSGAI